MYAEYEQIFSANPKSSIVAVCLIDDACGAFELRFDNGFRGETTAGIEIGFPLKKVWAAYGEPATQEDRGGTKKLIWSSKGILIWFGGDKVNQIVVFQKN